MLSIEDKYSFVKIHRGIVTMVMTKKSFANHSTNEKPMIIFSTPKQTFVREKVVSCGALNASIIDELMFIEDLHLKIVMN